ncbi:MAG: hypothetical protein V4564_14515 [Pseudomonadota bacterium]|uniref:hypothetical protein n=1 Tax=Sphingomonas sp. ERG5 TaxID=1381597 RepID=UPI00054B6522|nr:hypothetical protein [Sphingomonas sp. ERG5]
METGNEEQPGLFDRYLAFPLMLLLMFVAPNYIGDVSLDGLDAYILSAPVGSTREHVEEGVRHFEHCYYRKPSRIEAGGAVDYIFRGTTSDVGFFASVAVHCPFGQDGRLTRQCSRSQWALVPADVEAFERWSHSDVTQADEWSNAGNPECPVRD